MGVINVVPGLVCLGETLVFQLTGVSDTGGLKRENCQEMVIPPVASDYTWTITKPNGAVETGSGPVATVVAQWAGTYRCTFRATATRECPPAPLTSPTVSGVAVDLIATRVDATSPLAVKVWYRLDPAGVVVPSATFTAPGASQVSQNVSGEFYFAFSQAAVPDGTSTARLIVNLETCTLSEDVTIQRTQAHAPPTDVEREESLFRVPIEEGGTGVLAPARVTHTLHEQFAFICYSIPVTNGSKTLWVGLATATITTYPDDWIPTRIAAWNESHAFEITEGNSGWLAMTLDTGNTLPPQGPHFRSASLRANDYYAPGISLTGLAHIDGILFEDPAGPIWGIPDPLLGNTEIDLNLEANSNLPVFCP